MWCTFPGSAIVGGDAESDERSEPGPIIVHIPILCFSIRGQAIGAVIPDTVMDEAAAGVAPAVRIGVAVAQTEAVDFEIDGVVANHDGLAGGGLSAGSSFIAV